MMLTLVAGIIYGLPSGWEKPVYYRLFNSYWLTYTTLVNKPLSVHWCTALGSMQEIHGTLQQFSKISDFKIRDFKKSCTRFQGTCGPLALNI